MNKSIKDKIKNKLEEFGIEIYRDYTYEDEEILVADNLTITCNQNDVFVNFKVSTNPSFSARVILILVELKGIKSFYIGEEYIFDNEGKFIDGEEAYKYHYNMLKKMAIHEFMEEQSQLYLLNRAKSYNC